MVSLPTSRTADRHAAGGTSLSSLEQRFARATNLPCALRVVHGSDVALIGNGEPCFDIFVRNERGMKAIRSLHALEIIEAYMEGDLDIEGDFVAAMDFKDVLSDSAPWLKLWARLKPLLVGRRRCNPAWVAKHYDSNNMQLLATETHYHTYTPGLYESPDDTLEEGALRRLEHIFQSLQLEEGQTLLDVGCGWGGFMRYAGERGVLPTGISLSRDQLGYTRQMLKDMRIPGEALYQDFFGYEPNRKFDAISIMGVLEELSDYERVMSRVNSWLRPGGRLYFDFATGRAPYSTASFITKYVWPGTFRKVYLPEFIGSVWKSPFEIVAMYNDRMNYHLWSKKVHERWVERRDEILEHMTEAQWRMFRVLYAAVDSIMVHPSNHTSAQRVVLQLPA